VSQNIIGRIDADTILDQDWVAQAQRIFAEPAVDAVSGSITYHDMPWPELTNTFDMFFRRRIVRGMADEGFLQGANMALRCSSWRTVKSATCNTKGLHEDFDLAIHLHDAAQTVVFDPNLHVGLSLRRFDTSYASFWGYALQNPKTYTAHGRTAQRHMYPMIAAVLIGYPLIRLLYRSYDPASQKFSIVKLFADSSVVRVNPATFVD
jgi:cellulose synthase/poly-beta-1,6-N-acetylglucosamine synthase-like glycosyltransferase